MATDKGKEFLDLLASKRAGEEPRTTPRNRFDDEGRHTGSFESHGPHPPLKRKDPEDPPAK